MNDEALIRAAIDDGIDAMIGRIQREKGIASGDVAAYFMSGRRTDGIQRLITPILREYLVAERHFGGTGGKPEPEPTPAP
ncbi:hypothetical protein J2T57_001635 [Natronocella acetinitrilica]|uniref:Uncharacterized protein n=1 Tax=Natronocella acetinitrilica TaxID=414046 RepID=A0AAE3G517_9GAMM|nr:hypothetical protein [Natronocella acetinitrilica]MCP1674533.1 hypothetical protein [Natronocella acetinitrilica]